MVHGEASSGSVGVSREIEQIPISISISTMIGRIGNYCLEAMHEGARAFSGDLE